MDIKKSKKLSFLLRHHPEKFKITLDKKGYASIVDITRNTDLTENDISLIVSGNNKQRFSYNEERTMIKANQGHSIEIQHDFKIVNPQGVTLFHGTAEANLTSIFKNGLNKMDRHHVHLTHDPEIARQTGNRHGRGVVLVIDVKAMVRDKIIFYLSENNIWLTDYVPAKYITKAHPELTSPIGCSGVIVFDRDLSHTVIVKANDWGFPKGKKNKGETSMETAIRELYEETSLSYNNGDVVIPDMSNFVIELSNRKARKPAVRYFIGRLSSYSLPEIKLAKGFEDELNETRWNTVDKSIILLDVKDRAALLKQAKELIHHSKKDNFKYHMEYSQLVQPLK